jgi:hypothetical protein
VIAKQPALPRVGEVPAEASSYVRFEGCSGHCLSDLHYDHTLEISSTFLSPSTSAPRVWILDRAFAQRLRCAPTVGGGVSGQARRMRRRADCHSSTVTRLLSIMSERFRLGPYGRNAYGRRRLLQRPSCSLLTRFTISRNGGGYAVRGGGGSAGHVRGVRHPQ